MRTIHTSMTSTLGQNFGLDVWYVGFFPRILGPVHTYPEIFVSANFFMRIQKYLRPHVAYTNRIRPSTRIRFVSGHLKGLVNRACALQRKLSLR